ncbi:HAMP domain-containing protein [Streptomyces capparidis]
MARSTTQPYEGGEGAGEEELRLLLAGLTAVRDGDFGVRLPARGDGLMGQIAAVFNDTVDQVALCTSEVTRVAREVSTQGRLGGRALVPRASGGWKELTDSVDFMASDLTDQVRAIAQVATAVAKGDLSQKITVDARGEILHLKDTINTMVDQLSSFADEVTRVAREVGTEGRLGGQARVPGVAGTWKDLTDNVNSMANNLTNQVRNIAQVTTAVAQGDLTRKIDVDARGEILELKTTINTMVDQLSSFAAEVTRVAREVGSEGRLGGQAQVEGVSGTWKRLTENVNELAANLTRQVRAIAEVTSAVAEGDLTRSITVDASGEVAELKDNINAMVESLRETTRANQEQDWLKTNLARITSLVQGNRDLAVVAELVLDHLVPLVGAQYGSLYLVDPREESGDLHLIAGYGLPADRPPATIAAGQTLVGQAARARRPILVAGAPGSYVRITSSLGEAAPAHLCVLPILFEDRALGVIELASFHPFGALHRDFLERLMETIGVNFNTIIANARTDALLAESQRLAAELQDRSEELQAQQEELRRSNDELESKAALLARQNHDIEIKNEEIEQARQELEDRAQQLARASRYKSEFLANMSHELRTPLNSLLILARLLAQNPTKNLTPKQVEFATVIHSAGYDLLQLINDILDLSKVEAGKMEISPEPFDLGQLLDYVETTFRPLAAEKELEFVVEVAPEVPPQITTDEQRLRQILRNLLSNAVKFTDSGSVALSISVAEQQPEGRRGPVLAFTVRDTGIGIAKENLESVFGAFQQGDGTTSRRYGGTGLGLSISRELATLLGGRITADSELGRGSTFTLTLPVGAAPTRESQAPAPQAQRTGGSGPAAAAAPARRLLVVEAAERGLLATLARSTADDLAGSFGEVRITHAQGRDEALALLRERRHHCVLLDLGLPDAQAYTLLGDLDEHPRLREIPVLAHAAREPDPAKETLLHTRARTQPLEVLASLDRLRDRIALHLSAGPSDALPQPAHPARVPTRPVRGASAPPELVGRKVLVVDDDVRNVFAISSILEAYGMTVIHAPNGRVGIELLQQTGDVDVVLMDVMMPEMDGHATTAAIRRMPGFADLPVIAVTAKAMREDREKSLESGANDYVTKPVDTEELLACMARWCRARPRGDRL